MRDEKENHVKRLEPISPLDPNRARGRFRMGKADATSIGLSLAEMDGMDSTCLMHLVSKYISSTVLGVALRGCPLLNRRLAARTIVFLGFLGGESVLGSGWILQVAEMGMEKGGTRGWDAGRV